MKVVLLEELAAQFGLKTQDAIDRLQTLIADGNLSGQSARRPSCPVFDFVEWRRLSLV